MPVEFQFDADRTLAAVTYIASKKIPALTTYKLCKLVFLADKYHLVKYGRIITGDRYVAIEHGPVPSHLYDILKDVVNDGDTYENSPAFKNNLEVDKRFTYPHLSAKQQFDANELSLSDVEALDRAIGRFGKMDFFELKAITHEMRAFQKAWDDPNRYSNAPVMLYEDFFEEDGDAVRGAFEEMTENDQLRKAFGTPNFQSE